MYNCLNGNRTTRYGLNSEHEVTGPSPIRLPAAESHTGRDRGKLEYAGSTLNELSD